MARRKNHKAPAHGAIFKKAFCGVEYSLTVRHTKDGIRYVTGGTEYNTPSGAAKSIVKAEVNGWRFWGIVK